MSILIRGVAGLFILVTFAVAWLSCTLLGLISCAVLLDLAEHLLGLPDNLICNATAVDWATWPVAIATGVYAYRAMFSE